ncbi:hypothetical protein TRVL_06282 [Trypanosoma vivax]|nr:hypothetical protein TRVL_06282 [Trypanosoma vivax]
MEVSAGKTEYTLFGARETNLLSLKVGEAVLKEERTPKLLGLTMQPHKGLSKHVACMKAVGNTRLMQLRAVASPEWDPEREKLRAFYLALVKSEICYGVAPWWFDASLLDRERLERAQVQPAHMVAGIPKAANREDALRSVRRASLRACSRLPCPPASLLFSAWPPLAKSPAKFLRFSYLHAPPRGCAAFPPLFFAMFLPSPTLPTSPL